METESGEALQAAALERGNLVYLGPQMRALPPHDLGQADQFAR